MIPSVIPAHPDHAKMIAANLRPDAIKEVTRLSPDIEAEIAKMIERSRYSWAGFADDQIACLWGVEATTFLGGTGTIWLITTPLVEQYAFTFVRYSKIAIDKLFTEFSLIQGMVREDFEKSAIWLRRLGFTLEHSKDGYHYFYREAR